MWKLSFITFVAFLTLLPNVNASLLNLGVLQDTYCENDTHAVINTDEYRFSDYNTNATEIYNITSWENTKQYVECNTGCSTTLSNCRPNNYTMILELAALVFISMFLSAVAMTYFNQYSTYTVFILAMSNIMLAFYTDVFVLEYKIVLSTNFLVLMGILMDTLYFKPKRELDKWVISDENDE